MKKNQITFKPRKKISPKKPKQPTCPLPACIRAADHKQVNWRGKDRLPWETARSLEVEGVQSRIELWLVPGFGWCVPTLTIRNAGRRHPDVLRRTYAVKVDSGGLVRIGLGPHVTETRTIHLKKSNIKRLAPLITTIREGAKKANLARDRRSTLALRRSLF